jgi:hypothetical protein
MKLNGDKGPKKYGWNAETKIRNTSTFVQPNAIVQALYMASRMKGVFCSSPKSVDEAFIDYFKGVLMSSSPRDLSICEEVLPKIDSEEMNQ